MRLPLACRHATCTKPCWRTCNTRSLHHTRCCIPVTDTRIRSPPCQVSAEEWESLRSVSFTQQQLAELPLAERWIISLLHKVGGPGALQGCGHPSPAPQIARWHLRLIRFLCPLCCLKRTGLKAWPGCALITTSLAKCNTPCDSANYICFPTA